MKKIFTLVFVLCSLISFSQSTTVVISQVYGGGGAGSGTPTYKYDYVELHNVSNTAQSVGGFSVQYGSATGNFASTASNLYEIPAGTSIAAGKYLLIQLGAAGSVGADLPVTADFVTPNLTVSATNGKIALVNNATALGCGTNACAPSASIIDIVAFGSSNNAEGGAAVPVLSNTSGAVRKVAGCQDTNNNLADFDVVTAPVPRNAATAASVCGGAAAPSLIVTGTVNNFGNVTVGTNSASQTFNLTGTNLTGFPGVITITAPSTDFQVSNDNATWVASATIPYTAATLASTPVYVRFTPQTAGLKAGNINITGAGTTTTLTVAVIGTGVAASAPTLTTAGTVNDFGSVTILTNSASQNFTVAGTNLTGFPGVITIAAPSTDFQVSDNNTTWTASTTIPYTSATMAATTVYVRFTPQTAGAKTGNLSITGGGVTTAVTVAVSGNGVGASVPAAVRISQVYGGGGNASATYKQDFVELYNPGTSSADISNWSVQYASYNGPGGTGNWSVAAIPAGTTIGAGKYYLVGLAIPATSPVGADLPLTPDVVADINLSGTAGKIALVNNATALNGTTACSNAAVMDVVSFSTTANVATCAEGTPFLTSGIDNTKSMFRKNNGCTDTDNNISDIELGTVLPRNSTSAANVCSGTPALAVSGTVNDFGNVVILTNSASQSFTVSGTNLTGFPGVVTITAPSTDFQVSNDNTTWTATTTIAYTAAALPATTVYVRFTPQTVGVKSGNISITGGGTATALTIAVSGTGTISTPPTGSQVRISQVYGGGGNAAGTGTPPTPAATYNQDFVELFNSGSTAVDISGWSVQYASATGPAGTGIWNGAILPAGTIIGAGKYYLISFATVGTIGIALPTPDFAGPTTTNLSGSAGKVALVNNSTFLNGTTACSNAQVVDVVGFSSSSTIASCAEGTAFLSTGVDNAKGIFRKNNGCTDTNNNSDDFEVLTVAPRNSASAANVCPGGPVVPILTTAGTINDFGNIAVLTSSASQSFTVSGTNLTGAPDVITITAPSTDFQVSNDNVSFASSTTIPYTSATLAATPVYVKFTPQTVGLKTGNISITGGGTSTAITIAVKGTGFTTAALTAGALTAFGNVCLPNSAGPNSFVLSGVDLTPSPVTVAALTGYSYSTTATGTYAPTLSITQPGGVFNQTIYVKFTPTATIAYNGNIIAAGGSASSINIAASGTGVSTPPAVSTVAATAINTSSAQLNGTITAPGCSPVTTYGFEYSGINGFANGNGTNKVSTNLGTTDFSAVITNLAPATTYYYKAYAQNANGKTYGPQLSFTTGTLPDGLIIYSTPIQRGGNVHYSLNIIKPGHYAAAIYNSAGQKVFKKEMLVQVGFSNDNFTLPSTLPSGVYVLQIENYEFKVRKQFVVR